MRRRLIPPLLAAGVLVAVAGWQLRPEEPSTRVRSIVVERSPMHALVAATGNIVSRREAAIDSPVAAQVLKVVAQEGDVVKQGALLLQFDAGEAEARVARAMSQLSRGRQAERLAAARLERAEKLFAIGSEPGQSVREAWERHQEAAASARLAEDELRLAQLQRRQFDIRAPFSGTVIDCAVQAGQWIKDGTKLFSVADTGQLEIEAKIDSEDSMSLAVGQQAQVSVEGAGIWIEKVVRISPAAQAGAKSNASFVRVRTTFSRNRPLRLGHQVDVKIRTQSVPDAVKVPLSALILHDGKTFVAVVREGRVWLAPVVTGLEDLAYAQIVSGIEPGMRIILPEGRTFESGERVELREDKQ